MAEPLSSVEEELRKIEEEFHAGRMNAFGNQLSHERMEKELKKIKELDELIYARVGSFLERDDLAEWRLRRDLEPKPVGDPSSASGAQGTFGVKGVSDEAFTSASQYFSQLEREFGDIGEHLRKMSSHVVSLNQLAEVNNVGGGGRR